MLRNTLTATVAATAIAVTAPTFAHPGGGGGGSPGGGAMGAAMSNGGPGGRIGASSMGGPSQSGLDARINSMGPANASPMGIEHASPNSVLNTNPMNSTMNQQSRETHSTTTSNPDRDEEQSQNQNMTNGEHSDEAFQHASPNAFQHASPNSALTQNALPSALLPGLTNGLSVSSSTGASIGTVSSVLTTRNGSIAGVVVTSPNGQSIRIPASALTVSGSTVTVNSAELGNSVPTSFLPGLTTGLSVNTGNGTTLGTVSQINTGRNGTISSVVVTAPNGQTYTVPASTLSISGNTVTLNATEAFEGSAVPSSLLPGLATGVAVSTNAGSSLGTVSQVNTTTNGSISSVVVTASNGQTYTLPASSLSVSGGKVAVNTQEAFESTGVPSSLLAGLTTGMTVDTSAGTNLGTVSNVITENGNIADVVVTSSSGQSFVVPATSLSVSNGTVTVATMD